MFPRFPALYFAEDVETALCEKFGPPDLAKGGMNRFDLALADQKSFSSVSFFGDLDAVIDLQDPVSLDGFVSLLRSFKISNQLQQQAKKLNLGTGVVTTSEQLMDTLLDPDWRRFPMHVDIPANSQIFGQLIHGAGLIGVLYPSKYTKKKCLAVYPRNFKDSDSFIEIKDVTPKHVHISRLDSKSWSKITGC